MSDRDSQTVVSDRYVSTLPIGILGFLSVYFGIVAYQDQSPLVWFLVILMISSAVRLRLASTALVTPTDVWFDGFLKRRRVPLSEIERVNSEMVPGLTGPSRRLVLEGHGDQRWAPRFYGSSPFVSSRRDYVREMIDQLEQALGDQGWEPTSAK